MAISFQIDGSDMPRDPESVKWMPPVRLARKHGGGPLNSAKRSVTLGWDMLPLSEYATLEAKCDTSSHSIKVPHPNTGTYTTYTTTYLAINGTPDRQSIVVLNVEILADFITIA